MSQVLQIERKGLAARRDIRQCETCHRTVAVKGLHFRVSPESRTPALLAESRLFHVPVGRHRTAWPENVYFVQTGCPVIVHVTARISRIDAVNQQAGFRQAAVKRAALPAAVFHHKIFFGTDGLDFISHILFLLSPDRVQHVCARFRNLRNLVQPTAIAILRVSRHLLGHKKIVRHQVPDSDGI